MRTVTDLGYSECFDRSLRLFIMEMAIEFRMGRQGFRRRKEVFGPEGTDRLEYRGFSMLWPEFLVRLGLLRWGPDSVRPVYVYKIAVY